MSYGKKAGIRGRLLNADGQPIGGATLRLLTRDLRQGARSFDRKSVKTRSDGSFRLTVRARASRQLHIAWRARENDSRFAANGYLTLRARAAGSLHASSRSIGVGRRLTLRGRLKGFRRGGVPIVLQGKARGTRRWMTFADTTSSRRGTFKARYRFQTAAARGRTFLFRARIRRAPGLPVRDGLHAHRERARALTPGDPAVPWGPGGCRAAASEGNAPASRVRVAIRAIGATRIGHPRLPDQ